MSLHKSDQIEQYYTVAEVAKLLNVHEMTVRQWYASGKLHIQRVGRKAVRISTVELRMFLDSSSRKDVPSEPRGPNKAA